MKIILFNSYNDFLCIIIDIKYKVWYNKSNYTTRGLIHQAIFNTQYIHILAIMKKLYIGYRLKES